VQHLGRVGRDCVSDVGILYDFRTGRHGFSNCTVMISPQQIIGYNVSRRTSIFWPWICCLAGGYTDGPCPLQDTARIDIDYGPLKTVFSISSLVATGLWSAILSANAQVNVTQFDVKAITRTLLNRGNLGGIAAWKARFLDDRNRVDRILPSSC